MNKFMPSLFWGGLYAFFLFCCAVGLLVEYFATGEWGLLLGGLVFSCLFVLMLHLIKSRKEEIDEEKNRDKDYDKF